MRQPGLPDVGRSTRRFKKQYKMLFSVVVVTDYCLDCTFLYLRSPSITSPDYGLVSCQGLNVPQLLGLGNGEGV